ncbi:10614_t:CDS:1, partial [Paraglomus brasilianum]
MSFTEATKREELQEVRKKNLVDNLNTAAEIATNTTTLTQTDTKVELTESIFASTQEFETKQSEKGDRKYGKTKITKNNDKEISKPAPAATAVIEETKVELADTVRRSVEDVETKITKNNDKEISKTAQAVTAVIEGTKVELADTVRRSPFSVEDVETKITKNNDKEISKTAPA